MIIPQARKQLDLSQKKLRRARRLYASLIRHEIKRNPEIVFICAQRAIARGLYSPRASIKDGAFSILRAVYKADKHPDWDRWQEENGLQGIWWNMGHRQRRKMGKPVLRITA